MFIELIAEYGLFLAKAITFVVAVIIVIGVIVSAGQRSPADSEGHLEVKKLNEGLDAMEDTLRSLVLDGKALKQFEKQKKKQAKSEKASKQNTESAQSGNTYVIDFDGDMKASAVKQFREVITAVLTLADKSDEVVVRLESPGGMVHAYGFAASQLVRFKSAGIPLTICVDKVAASGGYMMACIADKLLAAPFAVIGSIGVVASIPNFSKVLKKNDVYYELLTAGEYKRTLTMFGENTDAARQKFMQDLEETHDLFKDFVADYRPALDIASVATGETWYGKRALDKTLIDGISTSDEYITQRAKDASVFLVRFVEKKHWQEKLGVAVEAALEKTLYRTVSRSMQSWESRH